MLLEHCHHHRFISLRLKKESCTSKMGGVRQHLSPHGLDGWINWRSIRTFQSSLSDPFETWLDQRMTYRQPQKDWVMHRQQQLSSITGRSPPKSYRYPPTITDCILPLLGFISQYLRNLWAVQCRIIRMILR